MTAAGLMKDALLKLPSSFMCSHCLLRWKTG